MKTYDDNMEEFLAGKPYKVSIEDGLKLIESCFGSETLKLFFSKYENLVLKMNNNRHFNYFGINFKNENIESIKFYAHIVAELTVEEILQFIPEAADYLKYIPFRNESDIIDSRNAGIALEIKYKAGDGKHSQGFFFHLRDTEEASNYIGFPQKLPPDFRQSCIATGVNFEYTEGKKLFKKYYYFNHQSQIKYFEKRFEKPLLDEVKLIEYSESNNFSKFNAYGPKLINVHNRVNTFSDKEKDLINFLNEKYNLINMGYGFYENQSVRSIYFFDAESNINPGYAGYNKLDYLQVNTLQKVINRQ